MPDRKDNDEEEYARLLRTEIERLQPKWLIKDQHLGELLAVIHGDGGQYKHQHGDGKATEDAIAIVCDLRRDLDQCRYDLAEGKRRVHQYFNEYAIDEQDAVDREIWLKEWSVKP